MDAKTPDRPLEPAEIAKLEAEARRADAEAAKFAAEAKEAAAKAESAETKLAVERFVRDREHEKRDRELADFKHKRIYNFFGGVDSNTCHKCLEELNYWHTVDPTCDIEIIFDSPGGSVFAGLALFDYIQELRATHHVTTATRGWAASMGGILLQAGDHRVMSPEAWILIHEVQAGAIGTMGDIEDTVELLKKTQSRILDIFAARSELTKRKLEREWRRKDWWISSPEALKWKLVDEIRGVELTATKERRREVS